MKPVFSQSENEALIRLLLAGRRQDEKVSLAEGSEFKKQISLLPWSSEQELEHFVVVEAARIRKTLATRGAEFVKEQCAFFRSDSARAVALEILDRVLASDGVDPREDAFAASVRAAMGRNTSGRSQGT